MENAELKTAIESLLFITDRPLPVAQLGKLVGEKDQARLKTLIEELRQDYEGRGAGMQVLEIAEGFQMASRPAQAAFIRKLYADRMTMKLSTAALETLSIVAYKQPITRAEIEQIRGVEVIAALETLLEKRLLKVVGRKETVGRPLLYGTTSDFLRHFGLKSLSELPPVESFKVAEAAPASPDTSPAGWESAEEPAAVPVAEMAAAPAPEEMPAAASSADTASGATGEEAPAPEEPEPTQA
ncbi:MAG: SMC-Scp complex subunit ScpB [Elusimicrobia bacterium]|nr:SMC-Scp complex subunit ScpB [Elusimicrobiota bacterium]